MLRETKERYAKFYGKEVGDVTEVFIGRTSLDVACWSFANVDDWHDVEAVPLFFLQDVTTPGYAVASPFIPHGISVVVNAPPIFQYLAEAAPKRHLAAAGFMGADVQGAGVGGEGWRSWDACVGAPLRLRLGGI